MVKDQQVRRLIELVKNGKSAMTASGMAGMCEKTARKYLSVGKLPSDCAVEHTWRTRADPFEDVWDEVKTKLGLAPGLEAKTLFEDLKHAYPGRFHDGQLRTLQRKVKFWRATEGPAHEIFFPQEHYPGDLGASDFCHMNEMGISITGEAFPHMLYHFVLTYSNWEIGNICFSESFESLAEGLQNALWQLGGVPKRHRTDSLSAAVNKPQNRDEFTRRYQGLLDHYGIAAQRTNPGRGNENGDIEQRHYRIRTAIDQGLMLRGSRDFASRKDYESFLVQVFRDVNAGRWMRLSEEREILGPLPGRRFDSFTKIDVRVGPSSTIRIKHNTYSVPSRLIGEKVCVRLSAEYLDIWYGQRFIEQLPRVRGEYRSRIDYRHIIDWLVRKPGAFANYRYHGELFPTSRFRIAFDVLREQMPARADREYLKILHLASLGGETRVDDILRALLASEETPSADKVEAMLLSDTQVAPPTDVAIDPVDLRCYDDLLEVA